jgi:hypothetical protein
MVCEHCGALCEDDALICFACGAPIGDDPAASGLYQMPAHLQAPITVQLPAITPAPATGSAPATTAARERCPRCGAPLAPDASICFECGTPIGVGSTRTGPLDIPDHLKAPITIELPVVVVRPSRRDAARTHARPTRSPRRPPTRREIIAAACIFGATLILLLAGAVAVSYRILPPPVPAHTIYRDPHHHFAVTVPALWQAAPLADGVQLTDSGGTSAIMITADPAIQLDAAGYADFLAQPDGLATLVRVPFAGGIWEQRAGSVRDPSGVLREHIILATVYEGTLYAIQFTCPASIFPDLDAQVYQPLLQSFAFDHGP